MACASRRALAQPAPHDTVYRYSALPFDVREWSRFLDVDGATVTDLSYASPLGGRVPAYVVRPKGNGPHPVVVFGHWLMDGSPLRNRGEFLEEAIVVARAGAIALLPDAPQLRPGFTPASGSIAWLRQAGDASRQQVIDVRRGLDMLIAQGGVDTTRIAYVGHSFGAAVGAILGAVDKRIGSLVLMAGGLAHEEYVFDDSLPAARDFRRTVGDSALRAFYREHAWSDPANFIGRIAPSAVLLQFGSRDAPIPERLARRYFALTSDPKEIAFYDAGHELDAKSRLDRVAWLARRLRLGAIDTAALARIPPLR